MKNLCLSYKGTTITYGRGKGIVVATGMDTVVFGAGLARGAPPVLMPLTALSLAVAAIPEALPAVVTLSLALGAKKMVKQNALIRKLPAVETLGSVTYICSDKTLTLNRMTVEKLYLDHKMLGKEIEAHPSDSGLRILLQALALSNDSQLDGEGKVRGDPTEAALFSFAQERGFDKSRLEREFPRLGEIPFDSDRKRMTTVHEWGQGFISFTKGAVESVLENSSAVLTSDGPKAADREAILEANERMAREGLRVLAVAMRDWEALPSEISPESVETELTILALVGMLDPPREEVAEAVAQCATAGIIPVMITGDHPATAEEIAKRIGIIKGDSGAIMTGDELEEIALSELEERVEQIRGYARVAPEQKLKIVKALQDRGQLVCMTGEGVNDAPALKRADIGVAMGLMGTDVAKEAAHMILLDDNFATIVNAVKEGRRIFDNIRKFIKYTMASNSGEIWTIFLAPLLGLPVPLLPIHILWINLVTDGLPGLALAAEPAEEGIMERPPRHSRESIFAHGLGAYIIWIGLLMGLVSIFTQAWAVGSGLAHWQTMVFTVLCLSQIGNVLALRSDSRSLLSLGLLSNKPLLGAFLLTFALQMAVIYVPVLNPIFKTEPLSPAELLLALLLSSTVFVAVELEKLIKRRVRVGRKGV